MGMGSRHDSAIYRGYRVLFVAILSIVALLLSACNDSKNQQTHSTESSVHTAEDTDPAIDIISQYVQSVYRSRLKITRSQISQLSWVLENSHVTPEMESKGLTDNIHREVPRSLARLYSLQLLRRGNSEDYQAFVAPQSSHVLSYESFTRLSIMVQKLDPESYETLEAAAIISAVTLSPQAIKRASMVIKKPLSPDTVQFLAQTAPFADKIYPLAKEVIQKYHSSTGKFQTVFMPHSHLRHMMYNEGSLSMYSHISQGIINADIDKPSLDLWYCHWLANIAGFRGHLAPEGSLYLDQNTFRAMMKLKEILDDMIQGVSTNPMQAYLRSRAEWLGLHQLTKNPQELTALGSLGASLRLFSNQQGSELYNGYSSLSHENQQRWLIRCTEQLKPQQYPSETYGPAVFANAIELVGLAESIKKVLPVYLDVLDLEKKLRKSNKLLPEIPLSFQELARKESVKRLLQSPSPVAITIDSDTGLAKLK